jgi:hypothetical protein
MFTRILCTMDGSAVAGRTLRLASCPVLALSPIRMAAAEMQQTSAAAITD